MHFADDAHLSPHKTSKTKQCQIDRCIHDVRSLALPLAKRRQNGMGQDVKSLPFLAFHQFYHFGSTVTCTSSRDANINKRIGKAATTLGRLCTCVSERIPSSYNACNVSTFVYGSEMWTTYMYAQQKRKLKALSTCDVSLIIGVNWRDKIPNIVVLQWDCLHSM